MNTCFMANKDRWEELDKLFDVCEKKSSVLVINFHNQVFNEKEYPSFFKISTNRTMESSSTL
jgi:hypothetical protein